MVGKKQFGGPFSSQLLSECTCFSPHCSDPGGGGGSVDGKAEETLTQYVHFQPPTCQLFQNTHSNADYL